MNPAAAAEALRSSAVATAVRRALGGPDPRAWAVGGAVRDAALGRPVNDLDLAVAADPGALAAAIGAGSGGTCFRLSEQFGTWRVLGGCWQADVSPLRGGSIASDLAARDFTIGAVAVRLDGDAGEVLDPFDGLGDLERGVLRAVGAGSFADDPLRLLRAARLAAELELEIEPATARLAGAASARAGEPAGERQLGEIRQLIGGPDPLRGLRLLDELGLTAAVLPELEALHGVEQTPNHHLDVHGHTLMVLQRVLEIENDLERFSGDRAAEVRNLLDEPLADEMTRGQALRFGAIVHDIGKPATRREWEGKVTFIGHDTVGAATVGEMIERLRGSRRLSRHLQGLTLHHLRLGFMVRERPLAPRRVHQYLRATEPVGADVTLLTAADRLAARGGGPIAREEMITAHLELVREMLAAALDWRRTGPPGQLIGGDELAAELGIAEGPELGTLLAGLEEAQYAGEVSTREEAISHARQAAFSA